MSLFESRGRFGPSRVMGENVKVLALRARLISEHGDTAARKHPDWPALKQSRQRKIRDDKGKPLVKAQVAELVAEDVPQKEIAPRLGISKSYVSKLWQEIVAELGPQAR